MIETHEITEVLERYEGGLALLDPYDHARRDQKGRTETSARVLEPQECL